MSDNKVHYRATRPEHFFKTPENPEPRTDARRFRSVEEIKQHLAKPIRASELGGSPELSRLRKKLGARPAEQTAFSEMLAASKRPKTLKEKLVGESRQAPTFRDLLKQVRTEKDT